MVSVQRGKITERKIINTIKIEASYQSAGMGDALELEHQSGLSLKKKYMIYADLTGEQAAAQLKGPLLHVPGYPQYNLLERGLGFTHETKGNLQGSVFLLHQL